MNGLFAKMNRHAMTRTIRFAAIALAAMALAAAGGCTEPTAPQTATAVAPPAETPPAEQPLRAPEVKIPQPAVQPAEPTTRPVRYFSSSNVRYSVVYVIDRSGSMVSVFPQMQYEVMKSVSKLREAHDFTIIYFGKNEFLQGPTKGLAPADLDHKEAANEFMKEISAGGSTTVLPALKRAVSILKYADPRKGRLIYFLSDGDFEGITGGSKYTAADGKQYTGNEAVIQWLRENNPKGDKSGIVHLNTYLYGAGDEQAVKVMKTMAEENGGYFKQIEAD